MKTIYRSDSGQDFEKEQNALVADVLYYRKKVASIANELVRAKLLNTKRYANEYAMLCKLDKSAVYKRYSDVSHKKAKMALRQEKKAVLNLLYKAIADVRLKRQALQKAKALYRDVKKVMPKSVVEIAGAL